MDWQTISRPYDCGGWNIKNLDWFSTAPRLKSIWLILIGEGIWSHIVKFKYLRDWTIDAWLHCKYLKVQGTSYIWNRFVRALSWISCYLGWKVGNGHSIRIGVDLIAGLNSDFVLPEDLRSYLEDYGITTLNDAQISNSGQ